MSQTLEWNFLWIKSLYINRKMSKITSPSKWILNFFLTIKFRIIKIKTKIHTAILTMTNSEKN